MALKWILALSLIANVFLALRLGRPISKAEPDLMHQFLDGFLGQMRGNKICASGADICHEGETLAKILRRVQDPKPFSSAEVSHRPDELLMWGLGLSRDSWRPYLELLRSSIDRGYFADGLGFGFVTHFGLEEAKVRCAHLPNELEAPCLWGVGRSLYFVSIAPGNDPRIKGGEVFAEVRMGASGKPVHPPSSAEEKLAVQVALAQRTRSIPEGLPLSCLMREHIVDCANEVRRGQ